MIINLWQKIHLYCGNHGDTSDPPLMSPHSAADSMTSRSLYGNSSMNMFYACPKYYPDSREEGEACCRNHISMKDFETMLGHISDLMEDAQRNDITCDLLGVKWKSRNGIEYKVTKFSEDGIDVVCLNSKGLWK